MRLVGGAAVWWLQRPLPLAAETVELSIEPGTSPREIAQAWVDAGVQTSPLLLYEWFRWSGQARRIRAGSYEIDRNVSPRQLLQKMVRGDETLATARLIEGWTFRQFRAELARAEGLKPTHGRRCPTTQLMAALGAPGVAPEGRFYPGHLHLQQGQQRHRRAAARLPRDAAAAGRRPGHGARPTRRCAAPTRR